MSALDRIVGQVLRSLRGGRAHRPGRRPYGGPPRRPRRPVGGPPRRPGRGAPHGGRGIVGTLRRLLRSGGRRN
ncbi:hypothetical protein CLV63_101287 [Murinocardiopsis flavida]|uniref:Uncharacterized protein n=1 Tax=Murinocardiopsis flavida TaxID=645275 RepID=A0A2P8DUB6_9ACTN|nr:hypothetical protein CLV63_101287 [Murinocardiopsis flavida]